MKPRLRQAFQAYLLLLAISIEFVFCRIKSSTFLTDFLKILHGKLSLDIIWPSLFSAILTVIKPGLYKVINWLFTYNP
jgi:hypothetical protein